MSVQELERAATHVAYEGKEYLEIKRKLSALGGNPRNVELALKNIDEKMVHYQLAKQQKERMTIMEFTDFQMRIPPIDYLEMRRTIFAWQCPQQIIAKTMGMHLNLAKK